MCPSKLELPSFLFGTHSRSNLFYQHTTTHDKLFCNFFLSYFGSAFHNFEVSTTSFRRCHLSTVSPITQATGHLYISRINPINNEIIKSNLWDLDGYNVYLHHIIDIRVLKIYLNCERAADLIVQIIM